jgi:hypothetical protein
MSASIERCLACAGIATALASGPAVAGPPFRTDDPEPVEFQHFEINLFSQGTRTDGGWSGMLPGFEVNYGALPNLQLHAIIPQGYTAPTDGRTGFALGDIELGVKYRFVTPSEDDWFPQVAVFPLVEVPAGNQKLGFSTGHAQFFLPVWLQKDFDAWTVYGGGGYWINPGSGNRNYGFFGVALWRKVTEDFNLGVEVSTRPRRRMARRTAPGSMSAPSTTSRRTGMRWRLSALACRTGRAPTSSRITRGCS